MAISPLSVYFNWCNPDGSFFWGGLAYIYIYIVLYLKKVGPGGGAEHIYIYIVLYLKKVGPGGGAEHIYIFYPYLGSRFNLTSIVFKWVGSTTN